MFSAGGTRLRLVAVLAGLSLVAAACGGDDDTDDATDSGDSTEEAASPAKAEWSYSGDTGPAQWGSLSPAYGACASGAEQSPIDVSGADPADLVDIELAYGESALTVLNNGHTLQANFDGGSSADIDGTTYQLLQVHGHAPSEHTIDGEFFPLELHFVHQDSDSGSLAVIGLMVREGAVNDALASMFENFPAEKGDPVAIDGATVNPADILPSDLTTYRYSGSLTTPPCSEMVAWNLLATPIEMSADQIASFTDIYDANNRPVQNLNDRDLLLDET